MQNKNKSEVDNNTEQPTITAHELMKKIGHTAFQVDFMKSPEDALLFYPIRSRSESGVHTLNSTLLEMWKFMNFEKLINEVVKETGADPKQLRNPKTRTAEQEAALLQAGAIEQQKRIEIFFNSLYYQALESLTDAEGEYISPGNPDLIGIKEQAVLYFFAIHEQLQPERTGTLTDEQKEELKALFYRLDKFYLKNGDTNNDTDIQQQTLYKFIEAENKNPQEIINNIQTIQPQYHVMANNALMNTLTNYSIINAGNFDMTVINRKGKRKEITAYTIASYEQDGAGALISKNLSEYERQVSDAIISIWEESRKNGLPPEFTTDMLFRAMPGSSDKASPQQTEAITKAIEKLRKLHIYVNVTEEMRVRGLITDKETLVFDDMFLSASRVTRRIKNGGQTVIAYHLHTEPLVLSYCKMTNQLITVSPKWLEVKKVKSGKATKEAILMTQERQAITGYLIRRINVMKKDKKNKKPVQSDVILFSTLFDDIGVTPDKQKAGDIRKFCFGVLEYYKAEKLITGYERQTQSRRITGIKIIL